MTNPDTVEALRTLIEEFARSGLATLHVRGVDLEVLLSNDPAAAISDVRCTRTDLTSAVPTPATRPHVAASPQPAAPDQPSAVRDLPVNAIIVTAPNLGTFYRAPKPGSAFYVEVGGIVEIGQEICLIEVMKLFTAVRSEQSGRVHAVLAEDGMMVEAGQPLFALVPN